MIPNTTSATHQSYIRDNMLRRSAVYPMHGAVMQASALTYKDLISNGAIASAA